MEDGDVFSEACGEALDGLRREGDFGDEDDGAASLGEDGGDGLEIDFGFAGSRDAEEEDWLWRRGGGVFGLRHAVEDEAQGAGLVLV